MMLLGDTEACLQESAVSSAEVEIGYKFERSPRQTGSAASLARSTASLARASGRFYRG